MKLDDGKKVDVLLAALTERYQALRTLRERVQSIGIWALGLLVGAGGWLIQTEEDLTCPERGIALLGLVGGVAVLRWMYLADLQKGFTAQQRTAAKLEAALGLYDVGVFDRTDAPIYPLAWAKAGEEKGSGRFFASTFVLLYFGALFLGVVIIFG